MIRFVLKSALALGLVAAVLPLGTGERTNDPQVDLFGLAVGLQQAVSDLGGFCTRAPQACTAARELAVYAGERVEEGLRIGYAYLTDEAKPAPTPANAETDVATATPQPQPDPLFTGAVDSFPLPRPYLPPKPSAEAPAASIPVSSVIDGVAVPTPAPRS